jgi:hypothetical protein
MLVDVGENRITLATSRFNGDQYYDIVVLNYDSESMSILFGYDDDSLE